MKKNFGVIIWILVLALTLFLTLIIPNQYTKQIWTVIIFDVISFVAQFLIWFMSTKSAKETFYKYPAMTVTTTYGILQFVLSLIVAIVNTGMNFKLELILNFVLMVIMLVLILLTLMGKDKIESLDSRQKNHHTEL